MKVEVKEEEIPEIPVKKISPKVWKDRAKKVPSKIGQYLCAVEIDSNWTRNGKGLIYEICFWNDLMHEFQLRNQDVAEVKIWTEIPEIPERLWNR